MRRYGKWVLTLGIVAVAPGLAAAASYPWQSNDTDASSGAAAQKSKNQQVAENIALALKKSAFHGYEIDIEYRNGLATLRGKVSDPAAKGPCEPGRGGACRASSKSITSSSWWPTRQGPIRQVTATDADLRRSAPHIRVRRAANRRKCRRTKKKPCRSATPSRRRG